MSLMISQPRIDVDSPVTATATFDPPSVAVGEESIYRVTFNALEESIEFPEKLATPPALQLRPGAHAQVLTPTGISLQPRTSFLYHIRATEAGQFTIPEFTLNVYGKPVTVPAAQLTVSAPPGPGMPTPQRLKFEVAETNLFVGQPVHISIVCPGSAGLVFQGVNPVQIAGQGFIIDQANFRQHFEVKQPTPGANVVTATYETTLTPIATGKLSAFAQGWVANRGSSIIIISGSGPTQIPSGLPQYTLLDSDPIALEVRPLPRDGQLPGFTGAIGTFAVGEPELAATILRVGEPVKLSVRVRGDGNSNLGRLVAPPPPKVLDWQVLAAPPDPTPPQIMRAQNFVTLSYTMIPLTENTSGTPGIPFCCFDPESGRYTDLTIKSLPVKVQPGASAADLQALQRANSVRGESEPDLALTGLSAKPGFGAISLVPLQRKIWFPLIQLLPAAAIFGLWGWDRRRRYLELHPEVVLRRRARRALHRERRLFRRAARAGDANGFAAAAVSAMRVVCAPHYPAEPRALVGSDVVAVLPEIDRHGKMGEIVRRFFHHTDAVRFASEQTDPNGLFPLQPDLERVLDQLEAELC
jgi:hypothetical protein